MFQLISTANAPGASAASSAAQTESTAESSLTDRCHLAQTANQWWEGRLDATSTVSSPLQLHEAGPKAPPNAPNAEPPSDAHRSGATVQQSEYIPRNVPEPLAVLHMLARITARDRASDPASGRAIPLATLMTALCVPTSRRKQFLTSTKRLESTGFIIVKQNAVTLKPGASAVLNSLGYAEPPELTQLLEQTMAEDSESKEGQKDGGEEEAEETNSGSDDEDMDTKTATGGGARPLPVALYQLEYTVKDGLLHALRTNMPETRAKRRRGAAQEGGDPGGDGHSSDAGDGDWDASSGDEAIPTGPAQSSKPGLWIPSLDPSDAVVLPPGVIPHTLHQPAQVLTMGTEQPALPLMDTPADQSEQHSTSAKSLVVKAFSRRRIPGPWLSAAVFHIGLMTSPHRFDALPLRAIGSYLPAAIVNAVGAPECIQSLHSHRAHLNILARARTGIPCAQPSGSDGGFELSFLSGVWCAFLHRHGAWSAKALQRSDVRRRTAGAVPDTA